MKILYSALLFFLFCVGAFGQNTIDSAQTAKLEVIKSEWKSEIYSPPPGGDPLQDIDETRKAQQDEIDYQKETITRARMGLPREPKPVSVKPVETASNDASLKYVYEIKVKNTGTKEINSIVWDYVFFERGTNKEVGRRQFTSKTNIEPGKTKNIVMRSVAPPTDTISAKNAGKKLHEQYSEQIVIQTIQYEDGSAWKAENK